MAIGFLTHDILIGSSGLAIVAEHQHARMGYWLGLPYWKHGYATEAVQAVLAYGFNQRELHWIYTPHVLSNPASGRVLLKVGMTYEGRMREHDWRFDEYVEVELYGMLEQNFHR